MGPDAARFVPALQVRLQAGQGAINYLDNAVIRMGPAGRDLVPTLLEATATTTDTSLLIRMGRVVYSLVPEERAKRFG